jgi:DNA repair protein RecN (Recombination protein N)
VLLDGFGGLNGDAQTVAALYGEWAAARSALEDLQALAERAQAEAEFVRAAANELSDFAPEAGEEEKLAGERALMMNAARIVEDVSSALESLQGDRGAQTGLAQAMKKLSRMNEEARKIAAPAETALEQAYALAEEARLELQSLQSRLDTDTNALERKEERLFALRALARKYGVLPDQLPRLRDDYAAKQDALSAGGGQMKQATAKVAATREAYLTAARKLSKSREGAAKKLETAVAGELAPLKLGHAKFRVALEKLDDDKGAASGLERIAFEVATVEGAAFGGLAKIASGAESGAGPDVVARRHGVRRSGPGRGRGGGRCGGRTPAAAGAKHAGSAGHPFAAGRGPRRAALPHQPQQRQDQNRTAGR